MTLPASGPIRLGADVNVEVLLPATTQISMGSTLVRNLCGVSSGAIQLGANGHGKTAYVVQYHVIAGGGGGGHGYGSTGPYSWSNPGTVYQGTVDVYGGSESWGNYGGIGGGGGGGMLYSDTKIFEAGKTYTATVGRGGAAGYPGNNGENTTLSSSTLGTITAIGGGHGGIGLPNSSYGDTTSGAGGNGGTGGGAGRGSTLFGTGSQGGNGAQAVPWGLLGSVSPYVWANGGGGGSPNATARDYAATGWLPPYNDGFNIGEGAAGSPGIGKIAPLSLAALGYPSNYITSFYENVNQIQPTYGFSSGGNGNPSTHWYNTGTLKFGQGGDACTDMTSYINNGNYNGISALAQPGMAGCVSLLIPTSKYSGLVSGSYYIATDANNTLVTFVYPGGTYTA